MFLWTNSVRHMQSPKHMDLFITWNAHAHTRQLRVYRAAGLKLWQECVGSTRDMGCCCQYTHTHTHTYASSKAGSRRQQSLLPQWGMYCLPNSNLTSDTRTQTHTQRDKPAVTHINSIAEADPLMQSHTNTTLAKSRMHQRNSFAPRDIITWPEHNSNREFLKILYWCHKMSSGIQHI